MNFSGKKMVLLLKLDSFPNTLNCFKNETSLPSGGPSPPDPLREGGVIAFKWPDRSPPRKKSWRRHWTISFRCTKNAPRATTVASNGRPDHGNQPVIAYPVLGSTSLPQNFPYRPNFPIKFPLKII